MTDSVERFEDRVADFARWRPGYPAGLVDALRERAGLPVRGTVADVGCGTGKLAQNFLDAGYDVIGVEPGGAMRAAARAALGAHRRFRLVDGRAEDTGLPAGSVDAIAVGQAFHWFKARATREEFSRILRPGGLVVLVWNDRDESRCPLLADYERLLRAHAPEYLKVARRGEGEAAVESFFAPQPVRSIELRHAQQLDWEGVVGRVMSASYVPKAGPEHDALLAGLRVAFDRDQRGGQVELAYVARAFCGRLA